VVDTACEPKTNRKTARQVKEVDSNSHLSPILSRNFRKTGIFPLEIVDFDRAAEN